MPGRVAGAWIGAAALAAGLGAAGFYAGGGLGAGVGVAAGGLAPLWVERATRRQEAAEAAGGSARVAREYGPAHLLEPGLGVVPFTGRTAELGALEAWCLDERAGRVRLVSGGGGAGKTRLALELGSRMAGRGWRCVQVQEGREPDVVGLERAAAAGARLLLIVDYAEARPGLDGLLVAAARDAGRVRVLLLARQAGEWWERLGAGGGVVRDMVRDASLSPVTLAADVEPGVSAEEVVRRAVPFFAARLGVPSPDAARVSVTGGGEPRVLDLHAAALVVVLDSQRQPAGLAVRVDAGMVLAELLGHEKHYWRGRAEAMGLLGGPDGLSMAQLSQVVAAGCLLGAATAKELAVRVPDVPVTEAVARWVRDLYPPEWDGQLGALRPDRLAELHVTGELAGCPALAEACLTGLDPVQARRALILLARASADQQAARLLLEPALSRFPEVIAGLAEPREVMIAVADAIPYPSLALAEADASISGRIAAAYASGTAGRARWLNTYAVLLGDVGRREDALAAIEEAVTIYRELVRARPDAFLPDLARSLNDQSSRLADLGRREDALAGIEEAVTIRRELARARPDAFLPDLAASLNNQSVHLADLGRRDDALSAIEEAVTIRRELARARPDAFLPDLATSLNNQSNQLAAMGRREDALAAIEEAVTIRRELARARPTVFADRFASSLETRAEILSLLHREADAQAACAEAAAVRSGPTTPR